MLARRLLLVEDDATFRRVFAKELELSGHQVTSAADGASGLQALASSRAEVALLDLRLPDMDGMDLMGKLLAEDPDLQAIMLTGHGAVPEAVEAMRRGAFDFLVKPSNLAVVEETIERAARHRDLLVENRRLRRIVLDEDDPYPILGESSAMKALRSTIALVGASQAPVLILGETGTGKELVARQLHRHSPRAKRPFVVVHCGAIPEALIESELFGHERGAFTGAERKRTGLFEAADSGTVFLDEIGELPLAMQPVLLRTLQFGELRPVGAERVRKVDVRVIAATHRNLLERADAGEFRSDLYYRLAALQIDVPPLRERSSDVGVLARAALAKHLSGTERVVEFTPSAITKLEQHAWPGNVRELENLVQRLAVFHTGAEIQASDIERHLQRRLGSGDGRLPTLDLEQLERLAVEAAMLRHGGDKRAAAAELGVALKTLYNKLARYGLRE